jgi:hypothetical protein
MNDFDLKKYLFENKLTTNSRIISEDEDIYKSYTLEVLPKFWEDLGIKRPASSFGDEAGMSYLSRDNTIELTVGDKPRYIYRRDTRIYDDKGRKAGRDDDSMFYMIELYKTHGLGTKENNILKYSLDFQEDKDAKIGGNMNLKPIGVGEFASEEVGSMDTRKFFKIVAVK